MKSKIYVLILAMFMVSCGDDFTNLSPISQRNVGTFYSNANEFELALNGAYAGLQADGTYNQSYWVMFEMRSDNTDQGPDVTGLANELAVVNVFTENALNQFIGDAYRDSYVLITRTNIILDKIGGIQMNDAQRNRIKGEAMFLRSLAYYHLAVAFDRVPLILSEVTDINTPVTQSNATAILTHIASDLEVAVGLLPQTATGANIGRATKGAANALLGKVYLTLGQRAQAATALRRVVDSGVYRLVDNYANLWGVQNENNPESVFEIQYRAGGFGTGSPFTNYFSPSGNLQNGLGNNRNRPTQNLYDAYEPGDRRRDISMATSYVNPATGLTVEALHILKFRSQPFTNNDSDLNWPIIRYADVLLMLAEALGEGTESYNLINQVRARAGLAPISASTPGSFNEKLLKERRVELAFENHRWADLKRFGVAQQVMAAKGYTAKLLFPIPQRELDVSPGMEQNPEHR
jgi:starch-binding outer membrane protein, SusD/RagB family